MARPLHIEFPGAVYHVTSRGYRREPIFIAMGNDLTPIPPLREPLLKVFPPALLGRLVTIPYYPLSDEMLGKIVKLQLNRIKKRVEARYKIPFEYGEDVVKLVVSRCTESESGGRMIDAILTNTMLPDISREFLTRMMEGQAIERVRVGVADAGFNYDFGAVA